MRGARSLRFVAVALVAAAAVSRLVAQEPAPLPVSATFEVTSVKRVTDPTVQIGARSIRRWPAGGRVYRPDAGAAGVRLPRHAADAQLVGGPSWIDTDRFEINATFDGPIAIAPNSPPVRLLAMERALLADRVRA